jgi:hypothetical protein
MKDATPILQQRISISPIHWDIPLRVTLLPYLRFTRSINRQLREFVLRYSPAPSKAAENFRRSRREI